MPGFPGASPHHYIEREVEPRVLFQHPIYLPIETQARVFSNLNLDEIRLSENYLPNDHSSTYAGIVKSMATVGDPLARIALDPDGAKARLQPASYAKFVRMISTLRDSNVPQRRVLKVNRDLQDVLFFEECADNADGNESILEKLIDTILRPEDRVAGREILLRAIGKNARLKERFDKRELTLAKIYAADESDDVDDSDDIDHALQELALKPSTTLEEKVAIAQHPCAEAVLGELAIMVEPNDTELCDAICDNPNVNDSDLCLLMERVPPEKRAFLARHPAAGEDTMVEFGKVATNDEVVALCLDENVNATVRYEAGELLRRMEMQDSPQAHLPP